MQSKAATVQEYLAELPADRRPAIERVRRLILENLDPVFREGMQYGMIGFHVPHSVYPPGYHCDPKQPLPFICLASQKNYMAVYLGCVYGHPGREKWFREAWTRAGKKLDMGKSCLRFRKLDDLALDVLGEAIRKVPARQFIQEYEHVIRNVLKKSRRRSAAKPARSRTKPSRPASRRRSRR